MKKSTTTQTARDIGNQGENMACVLLKKRGYLVVDRNFRSRFGEIDIIAKKDGVYHFVEVRLRTNSDFGTPAETVNAKKRLRIRKTIEYYCLTRNVSGWQFDIIGIQPDKPQGQTELKARITFYKNIPLL